MLVHSLKLVTMVNSCQEYRRCCSLTWYCLQSNAKEN